MQNAIIRIVIKNNLDKYWNTLIFISVEKGPSEQGTRWEWSKEKLLYEVCVQ